VSVETEQEVKGYPWVTQPATVTVRLLEWSSLLQKMGFGKTGDSSNIVTKQSQIYSFLPRRLIRVLKPVIIQCRCII
jgi:hypothetical protein